MSIFLAIFPYLPENIVARPWCSKTSATSIEDLLYQGFSNVLVSRQGGILLGFWKLESHLKREAREN
jgi:hypothetical protein